jgi:epoxyqueuosine reductase
MQGGDLSATVKRMAAEAGFDDCRIAPARVAEHSQIFLDWLAEGKNGDMTWLAKDPARRCNPALVVPGARSVIMLATNYWQGPERPEPDDAYRIARYAWNDDYHDLIESRMARLAGWLEALGGRQRCLVDHGPLLERDHASTSGLGWNGKSTMQIHQRLGTWFFLSAIVTTLHLPADAPARDRCGTCVRCIEACPTRAITAARSLDARRCISYLTIEQKGAIPLEFRRALGNRVYGCDDCLDACPWNRFAAASRDAAFQARKSLFSMRLRDFLEMDNAAFRKLFDGSPILRIRRPAFLRNVSVALGNTGSLEDMPALEKAAADPHPLIAEHAAWAIAEIRGRAAM